MALDHILCAVDGSEPSRRAVQLAAEMASGLRARLTLVSVRVFYVDRAAAAGLPTPEETDAWLAEAEALARKAGCNDVATVHLTGAEPAEILSEYATRHDAKLMVMGSTSRNAIERFVLGSTSLDFLNASRLPVTLVH